MSDIWDSSPTGRSEIPREFLVSAELYISTAAAAALRKPANPRKKRDSPVGHNEDNKKLREKSSWLALAKGSTGTGHNWRSATCKLSEEGERCLLNIYVDESILYQTVYVHLLNQTDIRQADSSLFFRKECLGIHCITGQRWTSTHTADPIYLQFSNTEACNTWFALIRSYAIPEIYGRWFFPSDGGSYRMWRQVELKVFQGRNLGNVRLSDSSNIGQNGESNSEPDAIDLDVSCEIYLNDILCGRTTTKRGLGSPDWHESFTFSDLPPFESLDLLVLREKKLFKPVILGSVRIPLNNFRRSEAVEGWFPILQPGSVGSDLQVGELRLKMRVDEEIILPYSAYSGLLKTFNSRNFLDWMADFESKLKLRSLSTQLMSIAIARNDLVEQVQELASREVDGTPSSHQTLFRGNTILTKVMELCMAWYGKLFLEASIGGVLRRLCAEKVVIEVDPVRNGKGTKDIERNVDQLIYWCREFWNQIYSVRTECPQEMRKLFETIRKLVEKRYRPESTSQERNRELPLQSVSAFCFLRFIVPAILHPHLFGLCPGLPSAPVQRSLTLIAKVIQSMANLNASVQKEDFMRGVKDFLRDSLPAMIDYILVVSTPNNDSHTSSGTVADRHDRLNVVNSLRQRASTMPVLDREAVPILPHLLDIPRHLAIITSAVIRSSRDFHAKAQPHEPGDRYLYELCSRCFEAEEYALRRVSQLATRISSDRRRASASAGRVGPSAPLTAPSDRPSTAPSPSEATTSHQNIFGDGSTAPSPPVATFISAEAAGSDGNPPSRQKGRSYQIKPTADSVLLFDPETSNSVLKQVRQTDPPADISDDVGKRKRTIFGGILRR